jgi:RNA polymerase sigma-32 factor
MGTPSLTKRETSRVSRERVRQIEVRAFEKVQDAVKSQIAEIETPHAVAAD